jgi:hypothetical protein
MDADPALHSNADPNLASKNNVDPCGYATLNLTIREPHESALI